MLSNPRRTNSLHNPQRTPAILFLSLLVLCLGALGFGLLESSEAQATEDRQSKPQPLPQAQPNKPLPYETAPQSEQFSPDREGGPDAYGYTFSDSRDAGGPVYTWQPGSQRIGDAAWQAARTELETVPWDDGVVTYTLPFAYNFYGTNYNVVHVSTNGNIHFGPPNDYWPQRIPNLCVPTSSQYAPKAMIAPLWFDFVASPVSGTVQGGVYTDVLGVAPNRTYVVEWRNVYKFGEENVRATFEVLVKESGEIIYQYQDFSGTGVTGSQAVVGIQDSTGAVGLPYTCYADDLTQERAIRYQLQRAVFLQPGDRTQGGAPGARVTFTQTVLNQTAIDNSFNLSVVGRNWPADVQPANTGTIPRGGSAQVTVHVDIPAGVSLGASDVATLTASSTLPTPGAYTDTAVLTTTASTLGADFTPSTQTRAGDFGSPVTYTVNLINRSGQSNIFQLGAEGTDWPTTISPTITGNIPADASVPVSVRVVVPSNATLAASDAITVTAAGQLPVPGQFFGQTVLTTTAGVWERKTNMPLARSRGAAAAFVPNGRIYAIGGEYNNGDTNLPIEEYDPLADTWTPRVSLQRGVSNVGAAVIGNAIYIPGGYSSVQPMGTVATLQVFYPLENRVQVITSDPLPAPRFGAGVAAYNGKLYVIGGSDDTLTAKNTVFEYDPARPAGSRWQARATMPTARVYLGAAEVDGTIYAAGGIPGNFTDLATLEAYHPATNSWSTRQAMSFGRGGLALIGVDSAQPGCGGYLYAVGGGWTNYKASAERYDPASNSWLPISSVSVARRSLAGAYDPSTYSLIAVGGWDGNYQNRTETIKCSGGLQVPTATPTVPVTTTATVVATVTPGGCALHFTDVSAENTFYPFVRCLACQGIISGYPCGGPGEPCNANSDPYFRPSNPVSRGQIAKIVSESAGFNDFVTGQSFEDVLPGSTFYDYVERLASRGVMGGYPCGVDPNEPCVAPGNLPYFRPSANATRGQLTKIVSNAAGFTDPDPATFTFTDVPAGSTFHPYVERLLINRPGAMNGYPCGVDPNEPCDAQQRPYFRPNATLSRGQTSKIVANTFFPNCQTP
ncbi:MAG: S-layer homology domain-containing protein [Chloroflexota bacterium]